jgi:glycosyltransferase involved in cell wall biosynthesis
MATRPRLTIGLPVYNGERYLRLAVESLLAQTFRDFVLIISDNASTDGTAAICEEYAVRDPRVHYLRQTVNRGASWNFRHVFECAETEYFKWSAHDDICHPEFVERCIEVLDRDPGVSLCFSKSSLIDEAGNLIGPYDNRCLPTMANAYERLSEVLSRLGLCHMQFGVVRSAVLGRTSLIADHPGADRIMIAQLALLGRFNEVPECLFQRRDHPSMSGRAHTTTQALAAWYNPSSRNKSKLLKWRAVVALSESIARTHLSRRDQLRCYLRVWRWCRWQWEAMLAELWGARDMLFDRLSPTASEYREHA